MRARRITVVISTIFLVVLAGAAVVAWCSWKRNGYNVADVDSRLLGLVTPYSSVDTVYYLDGGTICIQIVDRHGAAESFVFPSRGIGDKDYDELFVGAEYYDEPNAVRINKPEATKRMLIQILEQHVQGSPQGDLMLYYLRGSAQDYARVRLHKRANAYE